MIIINLNNFIYIIQNLHFLIFIDNPIFCKYISFTLTHYLSKLKYYHNIPCRKNPDNPIIYYLYIFNK